MESNTFTGKWYEIKLIDNKFCNTFCFCFKSLSPMCDEIDLKNHIRGSLAQKMITHIVSIYYQDIKSKKKFCANDPRFFLFKKKDKSRPL